MYEYEYVRASTSRYYLILRLVLKKLAAELVERKSPFTGITARRCTPTNEYEWKEYQ